MADPPASSRPRTLVSISSWARAAASSSFCSAGRSRVATVWETGRHAGHADILRELIDGSTGR